MEEPFTMDAKKAYARFCAHAKSRPGYTPMPFDEFLDELRERYPGVIYDPLSGLIFGMRLKPTKN